MTYKPSLLNRGLLLQCLRQFIWIGIIYFLALLILQTLPMFATFEGLGEVEKTNSIFRVGGGVIAVIAVPAPAAVFLFRYMQSKSASDHMHGLPIRRSSLLAVHLSAGLLLLLPPVWINAALLAWAGSRPNALYRFGAPEVWNWTLAVTLLTLLMFTLAVLVGICIGQSVLQGAVTLVLLLLPTMLIQFTSYHLSRYLYGFPYVSSLDPWADLWSPLMRLYRSPEFPFTLTELLTYAGLSVGFAVGAFILYRLRPTEAAGESIVFRPLIPLFKAGFLLCALLLAPNLSLGPLWLRYVLTAVIAYWVAEMIVRKRWNVWSLKLPLRFLVYAGLVGLLLYVPVSPWNGYESRVPDADRVEAVYVGDAYKQLTYRYSVQNYPPGVAETLFQTEAPYADDPGYVEAARKLHQALVAARPVIDRQSRESGPVYSWRISYKLNNGRTMERVYWIPTKGFEPELKALMESVPFKAAYFGVDRLELPQLEEYSAVSLSGREVRIIDREEVAELTGLLKENLLAMTYEEITAKRISDASIRATLRFDNGYSHGWTIDWNPGFKGITEWLEQKGYAEMIRVKAEDVRSAELYPLSGIPSDASDWQVLRDGRAQGKVITVQQPELLAYLLEEGQPVQNWREQAVLVRLVFRSGAEHTVTLGADQLTPELSELLKP